MNEICKKYGITEEQYKNLLSNGWISTTIARYEEIYHTFRANLSSTGDKVEAINITSDQLGCERSTVYRAIKRFE